MSYPLTIPIALGSGKTGLTLSAQLFDVETGDDIGSPLTNTFLERAGGNYFWTGDLPDNQAVGVAFFDGATELVSTAINPSDVYDILAIKAKTDALNVDTVVTVATPIDPVTGDITIVRGDAYLLTTPKGALVWTEDTGLWLPYVGKTSVFTAKSADKKSSFSATATVAVVSGDTVSITVELDSAKTKALTDKSILEAWTFDIQSTIASLEDDSPLSGALNILADVSPAST